MLKTFSEKIKVFFHFLTKFRQSTFSPKSLITPKVFRVSVTTAFKPSTIRFSPSERIVKKCCLNICHKFFFFNTLISSTAITEHPSKPKSYVFEDKIEEAVTTASNVSSALNPRNSSVIVFELSSKRTPIE